MEMVKKAYECAIKKLARRDMSIFEMENHLKKKGFQEDAILPVIEDLKKRRYLDDERYCSVFARHGFDKHWSDRRIKAELYKRGVTGEIVDFAIEDLKEETGITERELAEAETVKVLREASLTIEDPVPDKIRGRIARRLSARGFNASLIYDIINGLKNEGREW